MSGKVMHFEIPFDDGNRASGFYRDVFGWQLVPMPEMDYTMVMTGPSDPETGPTEPGFINGGMFKRGDEIPSKGPNVVIDVASVDDALGAVESAGGTRLTDKQPVGDMGFTAYFSDTEGNVIGLWESA
ncbi:putative enzyme related to lactoylglutathione lyase [Nocardioides salarius]|uniref:Enzyme related to lactoylglutathione lyase n=1 Tax=Nocardioides salarius TaxID=374513 RepID=A0ABS2MGW8_9ACTN|nr:VOC family protein [Nocardioides salarius]MBM7510432.1 putative enzyme related to lactoylglutathione lyase [Nocardioides salarius]